MGFLWVWEHQAGLALNPNFLVGFGSASLFPLVGPFHPLQSPPADSQGPIFLPIPHQGMQRGPHSPSRRCQGAWLSLGTASSRDHSPGTPGSPPSLCHAGSSVGTPMLGAAGLATLGSTGMNFLGSLGCASSTNCHWGGSLGDSVALGGHSITAGQCCLVPPMVSPLVSPAVTPGVIA